MICKICKKEFEQIKTAGRPRKVCYHPDCVKANIRANKARSDLNLYGPKVKKKRYHSVGRRSTEEVLTNHYRLSVEAQTKRIDREMAILKDPQISCYEADRLLHR